VKIDLIGPADPRWDEMLASTPHDVYHRPEWALGHEQADGGDATAVFARDGGARMLIPLIKRRLESGYWDASSPYGYAGPLSSQGVSAEFVDAAVERSVDELRAAGCVSLFVRLHPVLGLPTQPSMGHLVEHGQTVSVDLTLSHEALWAQTRKGHRSDINRARREGVIVAPDAAGEHLDTFVELYHSTMRRVGASSYYFFAEKEVVKLAAMLGDAMQLWVALEGDVVIGGALFLFSPSSGIVQYHLSAASEAGQARQPAKLILDEVRRFAKDAGFRRLHLGGGLGAGADSLYRFKAGFSTDSHAYASWRVVIDEDVYRRLCEMRGGRREPPEGFFPAYRAPSAGEGL
jgi:hypothetical protein